MSIWSRIEEAKASFTSKELEVYNIFQEDPYSFSASTAGEIAKKYHISQSAISRFCQKVGFDGFSEFRLSMMVETSHDDSNGIDSSEKKDLIDFVCEEFQVIRNFMTEDEINSFINRIMNSRCTYTSGYGVSAFAASWFTFHLVLSSIFSINIPTSQEMESLRVMNSKDTIILFSNANPSHRDFFSIYNDLPKDHKPYVILIANTKKHPLAKYASQTIVLPTIKETQKMFLDASIPQIAFTIFLSDKIMKKVADSKK